MAFSRPDEYGRWADTTVVQPLTGQDNVVEPPDAKKDLGWDYQEKPPRNWFNWLLLKAYQWTRYLDEKTLAYFEERNHPGKVDGLDVSNVGGLNAEVDSGQAWVAGERFEFSSPTIIAMTNNATNFIYLDTDGVLKTTTTATTAFTNERLPLATVVTVGGVITDTKFCAPNAEAGIVQVIVNSDLKAAQFEFIEEALEYAKRRNATGAGSVEIVIADNITVTATLTIDFPVQIRCISGATIFWGFNGALFTLSSALAQGSRFLGIDAECTAPALSASTSFILTTVAVNSVEVAGCSLRSTEPADDNMNSGILITGFASTHWRIHDNHFQDIVGAIGMSTATSVRHIISDNVIVRTNVGSGTVGINCGTAANSIIANNSIYKCTFGIICNGPRINVIGNRIQQTDSNGILVQSGGTEVNVEGNYLHGVRQDTGTTGAIDCDGDSVSIIGNHVFDWGFGWAIRNTAKGVAITGNFCVTGATANIIGGILYSGAAATDDFAQIVGNHVELAQGATAGNGADDAIGIQVGANSDFSMVVGNMVMNCGNAGDLGTGILMQGDRSIVSANYVENVEGNSIRIESVECSVTGNVVRNFGAGVAYDFQAASDRSVATGNVAAVARGGASPVNFEAGAVDIVFQCNQVDGTYAGDSASQFIGADAGDNNFHF